jgi:hypothetical protein
VSGERHALAALPRYPLDRRLGGPQRQSGRLAEDNNILIIWTSLSVSWHLLFTDLMSPWLSYVPSFSSNCISAVNDVFEILTVSSMKNMVLWIVIPCNSERIQRFGGTHRLYFQTQTINQARNHKKIFECLSWKLAKLNLEHWRWRQCSSETSSSLQISRFHKIEYITLQ